MTPRVIATTFAGRRDRMEILLSYLLAALDAGIVHEYHIWDYARRPEDRRWLRGLPARHPGIRLMSPPWWTRRYQGYYRHYRADDYRDAIFLKLDDDIVYLDLDRLADFIAFRHARPDYFLVSANVVNNGVCAYYQQECGIVPTTLMELPYPERGYCGKLWQEGALAERLQHFFLDQPERFRSERIWHPPDRLSINFVAYLGADIPAISRIGLDDEEELSVTLPRRLGRQNAIFGPLVVSHLSFYSQEQAMDVGSLLDRYRLLRQAE